MKHIITESGFECDVNPAIARDYRTLKTIAAMENPKVDATEKLVKTMEFIPLIIGEEGEARLMEHVQKDGIIDTEAMYDETKEILAKLREEPETKNS